MPVWLRKFTYKEISVFYEKEKEEYENSAGGEKITANSDLRSMASKVPKVNVPNFVSKVKGIKK